MPSSEMWKRPPNRTLEDLGNDGSTVKISLDAWNLPSAVGECPRPIVIPERYVKFQISHFISVLPLV